jgi:hypothetical protein
VVQDVECLLRKNKSLSSNSNTAKDDREKQAERGVQACNPRYYGGGTGGKPVKAKVSGILIF